MSLFSPAVLRPVRGSGRYTGTILHCGYVENDGRCLAVAQQATFGDQAGETNWDCDSVEEEAV